MLVNSLGALAVRHAFLFGREETAGEDWAAVARAAADSVPEWSKYSNSSGIKNLR
jgi:hypothetical protein